jgi:uncharacterized protein (DUF1697 family)
MKTYISILRGINVSGHKMIKMKALQELYERLGFRNVRTYIQSGNVVFENKPSETGVLEKMISGEILESFGFEVPVIVLEKEELINILSHNAFIRDRNEDISRLHVTILSRDPENHLVDNIGKEVFLPDEYCIIGKAVYLFCPNGYGNTKLSNTFFEKKLKVLATTRNWKTVLELVKMSENAAT